MFTFLICLTVLIITLTSLAELNDLPRAGNHIMKLGISLSGASAVLIALVLLAGKNVPSWLLATFLLGSALRKLMSSPFTWWRWIMFGERRKQKRDLIAGIDDV